LGKSAATAQTVDMAVKNANTDTRLELGIVHPFIGVDA
jgi:hypothetical protein